MRSRISRLIFILAAGLFLMALVAGAAQAAHREPSETKTWLDISFNKKVAKKTKVTLTQHLRWDDLFGQFQLFAPEFSVRQKLHSWWRIEGGYRYQRERDNGGLFQHRHRVFANSRFRLKTSAAAMELRLQWQEETRHELDDGASRRHVLRTRAKLQINTWKDFKPYTSAEIYHRLDDDEGEMAAGILTKLRLTLGAKYESGPVEYDLRYLLVVPLHEDQDPLQHVLRIGMGFDLP
jgi:hypothetical protein